MNRLVDITDKEVQEILNFLYLDEIMNVFLIHYFEKQKDSIGEVYIGTDENEITEVVHIKYDGNSHFTSFYSTSIDGLDKIAKLIQELNYSDILLAGIAEEVEHIMTRLDIDKELDLNTYYQFNVDRYDSLNLKKAIKLRKAIRNNRDIKKIKKYFIGFFGAETKEEIQRITSNEKIHEDMENGIYLLEIDDKIKGMARFFGESRKYIDITTVYIDEEYRGKGYGKMLMQLMLKQALEKNKIPIIQVALSNEVAKHIYEDMGFHKVCDYTFQFII
ncbi:GNAT family N-acetyltransferase [Clostridium sp. D2Q-14]|uniref:GNAT family N-acetyltransferase n=1 Tax=Anaeromonas gelatinilytica TaxID=2683194 RepID=UPI00193BA3EB|nr:GNAT family N-acetyltransferase [Anaeromonas gelatinilytica]MBS4535734.1 GNAT family N-acetyltransferase [Anaeromonas gelatinilytica]